jgi:hypothetical protein
MTDPKLCLRNVNVIRFIQFFFSATTSSEVMNSGTGVAGGLQQLATIFYGD